MKAQFNTLSIIQITSSKVNKSVTQTDLYISIVIPRVDIIIQKTLDLNELDNNQRIKMLQVTLQYTLPKLKQEADEVEDLPLFID